VEDDERLPIEEVLPGHRLHPMEDGWTPLASFNLIKCLDGDGDVVWAFRTSEPFNLEELLGALVVQAETLKRKLIQQWEDDDPDHG
jgi:hypothetical protein